MSTTIDPSVIVVGDEVCDGFRWHGQSAHEVSTRIQEYAPLQRVKGGGQLAGQYFLDKGRRRFLFIGDTSFREFRMRREGLQSVVDESDASIAVDEIELHSFRYESAYGAATRYLDVVEARPDAVFAFNDTAAMAFISAFRDKGIHVPRDVSVVGYNDIPATRYFSPPITTIRQDTHQAGRVLAAKLMRILDGDTPRSTLIRTELIVRET